ncbi:MAG: sulfur carrier protein ThiS [Phycisphaeraceae bacterium]|nr:sulfur carrier protein ThiS [Phycisphaeraceae bacterium]
MKITVNDKPHEIEADATVADLLNDLDLAGRPAAVEVNRTLVPRAEHAGHRLAAGDTVEVVTLVGGG